MKLVEVKCRIHGIYEKFVQDENDYKCSMKINGKPCGEQLEQKISVPNIHYKGNGFYSTDN